MPAFATLYTYPHNPRAWKIMVAAKVGGLEIETAPDFKLHETNKSPEFLAKYPFGKVPALETADGFTLFESTAIQYFVAESGNKATQLLGGDVKAKALVMQWVSFADQELVLNVRPLVVMMLGLIAFDEALWDEKIPQVMRALKALDASLAGKKYLVGDALSIADISTSVGVHLGFKLFIDAEDRKSLPNVVSWFNNVMEDPAQKAVLPPVEFLEVRKKPEPKAPAST